MVGECTFCAVVAGRVPASIVHEDAATLAFLDLRQAVPGHTLVITREHVADLRALDAPTAARLMATLARVTRAVADAFENDGLSIWHSIGPAAFQEVPHLHLHVQPRLPDDGLLRIYPTMPEASDRATLEEYAERLRRCL